MSSTIFYFSGSGNSLWTARKLAEELGHTEIVSISDPRTVERVGRLECAGLVFPVHIWGVPGPVLDFIARLKTMQPRYLFAAAVNAGEISRTLIQLDEVCSSNGLTLAAAVGVRLPSNYIPWGGPGSQEEIGNRIAAARIKIATFAKRIRNRETWPPEKGPLWKRILFTLFYRMSFKQIPTMDSRFTVDERCNGCAVCARVCPTQNIALVEGKPAWQHRCTQCLACLQWCPQTAIQLGPKTHAYPRYHHPEIKLADMLAEQTPSR